MNGMATLSSKGQVTIPKDIRDYLSLRQMDRLFFAVVNEDFIVVQPVKKDFLDFGGSINPKNRPEDFQKIRKIVRKKNAQSVIGRSQRA